MEIVELLSALTDIANLRQVCSELSRYGKLSVAYDVIKLHGDRSLDLQKPEFLAPFVLELFKEAVKSDNWLIVVRVYKEYAIVLK